jgi:DUF2075 family protein
MALWRGSASGLASSLVEQVLIEHVRTQFSFELGHSPSPSEANSWQHSLPVLSQDLVDAGLSNVEVLVEERLPLSSKRIDAILCGQHPKTGHVSFVVVELKQWTHAVPLDDAPELVEVPTYSHPVTHPVAQVNGYVDYLVDFTRALEQEEDAIVGAAYLHNASASMLDVLGDYPVSHRARMFVGGQRDEWLTFLRSRLSDSAPGSPAADVLLKSKIGPSKQLLQVAADEVQRREQFVLLDEQQVAFALVMRAVKKSQESDHKEVIIITGGPGSGKSVIALSLLGALSRDGVRALHATGSSSFTNTLRKVAGARNPRVKKMFQFFNQFGELPKNGLDVLIADEAHRIRETSANRYMKASARTGKPQIAELIDAARVPVFLLDAHQVVRPGEIGSVPEIRAAAGLSGLAVREVNLDAQFRSGGSRAYEQWVLRLLGLEPGGPIRWRGDDHFELRMADSAEQLESQLRAKVGEGYSARISAGYCWTWTDAKDGEPLPSDVKIGSWSRPWNNKEERRRGDAPARSLWATDDGGFDQVGCVYTAQGFEYDWSGVILGPDLGWEDGRVVVRGEFSKDPALRGLAPAERTPLILNTYKVLLTRGMVGTSLFVTDADLRTSLSELTT